MMTSAALSQITLGYTARLAGRVGELQWDCIQATCCLSENPVDSSIPSSFLKVIYHSMYHHLHCCLSLSSDIHSTTNFFYQSVTSCIRLFVLPCFVFPLILPSSISVFKYLEWITWLKHHSLSFYMIVWKLRGNIIRTALCWILWHSVHSLCSRFSTSYKEAVYSALIE